MSKVGSGPLIIHPSVESVLLVQIKGHTEGERGISIGSGSLILYPSVERVSPVQTPTPNKIIVSDSTPPPPHPPQNCILRVRWESVHLGSVPSHQTPNKNTY